MGMYDPANVIRIHGAEANARRNRVDKRVARIMGTSGDRLVIDENDSRVEIVETALGIKPGGDNKIKEILGLDDQGNTGTQPAALAAPTKSVGDYWRVHEADGQTPSTDIEFVHKGDSDQMRDRHLVPLMDPNNLAVQIGLKKQSPIPTPPAPATSTVAGDRMVSVWDKKGRRQARDIKVSEGCNDPNLEVKMNGDYTQVDHFEAKPRFAPRS